MRRIGCFTEKVINALGLSVAVNTPIYIGQSNIAHILRKHAPAYAKYSQYISDIVTAPDYARVNPSDGSVEYVKEFAVSGANGTEYVKVAVRVSGQGVFFVRSLYVLNFARTVGYISKGTLKKI